ncbi:sugar ABC transporter substrate-binding protein [Streptomyces graminilatus]|uniref:sugar ABC transporter substrate-binding protein n=1 Tax=Streptomyces graminilatus TaxID=1464070 RepID=UPI0006E17777|nr:substrate-binding domain-containing protein [Streptomyces graminilatus]
MRLLSVPRPRAPSVLAAACALVVAVSLAGCGGNGTAGGKGVTVGLLMPNRQTPRWEAFDRPLIEKRVKELCPECSVRYANADNDTTSQQRQMTSMITRGVDVLILDVTDPKALRSSVESANKAGVPVVAYDRLAEGPVSGYVTFDGTRVGRLQGQALLDALGNRAAGREIVMMNGDPTSPNYTWFKEGALSVLKGKVKIGRSYDTLGWRAESAHDNMSAAINALGPNRIDGVLAANDSIATGVISAMKSARVSPLPPVTGQDADLDAVRRIVGGEQTMTVFKSFQKEADTAAAMAVALGRGESVDSIATTTMDSPTTKNVPTVLLTPVGVTADTIGRTLVKDGVYTVDQICTPKLRAACDRAGLTG